MLAFCQKKELACVLSFLGKKSLEIKRRLQNAIEKMLPYCKLKIIFRSPSRTVHHFHFKYVLPKDSALATFIVLSVIAITLFITVNKTPEQLNI